MSAGPAHQLTSSSLDLHFCYVLTTSPVEGWREMSECGDEKWERVWHMMRFRPHGGSAWLLHLTNEMSLPWKANSCQRKNDPVFFFSDTVWCSLDLLWCYCLSFEMMLTIFVLQLETAVSNSVSTSLFQGETTSSVFRKPPQERKAWNEHVKHQADRFSLIMAPIQSRMRSLVFTFRLSWLSRQQSVGRWWM